jgi:hypothetical protein
LRPNTRFRIDEYTAPRSQQAPETGRSFYSLLKGGFHTITQSLGRRSEHSYRVRTPVATIGIRGTHYSVQWCDDDCPKGQPDGLHVGVFDGIVNVKNDGGGLDLGKGQQGYVQSSTSAPVLQKKAASLPDNSPLSESYTPEQPIIGTDSFGNPVDLTPGQTPDAPHEIPNGPPEIDGGGL